MIDWLFKSEEIKRHEVDSGVRERPRHKNKGYDIMIDWIKRKLFGVAEEWKYERIDLPITTPTGSSAKDETFDYPVRVRYTKNRLQIYVGAGKALGWKDVESDSLRRTIRKQL